jgi:proteasome beta subunit
MQDESRYMPGATTIGIACKDGVVLASEKRVSYGYMIMSKTGKKVFKITDRVGASCAGLVSDMQILIRDVTAYANLYALERERPISVKAVAKTMSFLLYQRRLFPFLTQTIIGGIDEEGPSIYILDPLGSLIPDKYACVGSGAEIAVGVLESMYKDELSLEKARDMAIRAIKSAVARDIASGDGADLLIITKDGIKEEYVPLK